MLLVCELPLHVIITRVARPALPGHLLWKLGLELHLVPVPLTCV